MLTAAEVAKHDRRASCWVTISGQAYDMTDFLDHHPGGPSAILRYAGKDATETYWEIHPEGLLDKELPKEKHLGPVEPLPPNEQPTPATLADAGSKTERPPLSTFQNLDEFEADAKNVLSTKAWVFYSSATDSLTAWKTNKADWTRVSLRPRILRNVFHVSMKQRVMGHDSDLPIFIAPAAQAKLGHPDGELCLARGAARYNIPQCTSTYSSIGHKDLAKCLRDERKGGAITFQLYVPKIRKLDAKNLIRMARELGFKALVVTVDSAVIGKREEDDRYKAYLDHEAGIEVARTTGVEGDAPVLRGAHNSTLEWDDLRWMREEWGNAGPVILKGIQTVEDALEAAEAGIDGIYLSNHGGRQLDHAPSSLQTLLEIRKYCPELLKKLDIYLDGGATRGTDVVKALCLGAKAVGFGRPFMYALSCHGTEGVCKAIEILSDEIQTTMRLMGVTDLSQLSPYYVNTSRLENEIAREVDLRSRILPKL